MKINWNFILGFLYGLWFISIGLLNNALTNGKYASGTTIVLMFVCIVGFVGFLGVGEQGK